MLNSVAHFLLFPSNHDSEGQGALKALETEIICGHTGPRSSVANACTFIGYLAFLSLRLTSFQGKLILWLEK